MSMHEMQCRAMCKLVTIGATEAQSSGMVATMPPNSKLCITSNIYAVDGSKALSTVYKTICRRIGSAPPTIIESEINRVSFGHGPMKWRRQCRASGDNIVCFFAGEDGAQVDWVCHCDAYLSI